MAKAIAIDYGTKRCGIATTDPLQIIASGLITVETKNLQGFIVDYLNMEDVECLVIGQATRMSGALSQVEESIIPFINFVKKRFPKLTIVREDEAFTSQIAFQTMIDGGLKKKQRRDKALVDKISATLILQRYLENKA